MLRKFFVILLWIFVSLIEIHILKIGLMRIYAHEGPSEMINLDEWYCKIETA